jgi:gamma-glutamyltranspeptidase/glutathione hydrolase
VLRVAATCAGIGGDVFALFYSAQQRKVHCLQGNGAAPAGLSIDAVRAAGRHQQLRKPTQ